MFVFDPESLLLLEIFVKFELFWIFANLTLLDQFKVLRRLILVNVDVQIDVLNEFAASFRCLQIVYQHVLGAGSFYALRQNLLLGLQNYRISDILNLKFVQIFTNIFCIGLHKFLESSSSISLGSLAKKLIQTILQDLILEIKCAKRLFLLSVLPDHSHDFAQ